MIQSCKHCHKQFDNTKQRSDCPHREFPTKCNLHNRYNCGNKECSTGKILKLESLREEAS